MGIILRRTYGFGDVLWVEPIARYFLSEGLAVNIVTEHGEAFAHYLHELLSVNNPHFFRYTRTIDLDGAYESRPHLHLLKAYQEAAQIPHLLPTYPQIHLSETEKERKIPGEYVIFHLEETSQNFRNVYGIDWKEVRLYLENQGYTVFQIAKYKGEPSFDRYPTQNFREVISLLHRAKMFIGLDSGPSHIAAALGIPSLLFFGSVNPFFRHLPCFKGIFLQGACEKAHCYHLSENPHCLLNMTKPKCSHHTTDAVLTALSHLITKAKEPSFLSLGCNAKVFQGRSSPFIDSF